MKKKILGLLITFLFIFTNSISNVSATVLTINEIYEVFKTKEEDGFSIQINDNTMKLKMTSENGFEHEMDLVYENNILKYTNTRDISNMTKENRVIHSIYDNMMTLITISILLNEYDIDDDIDYEEFGINIIEGEEISYEVDERIEAGEGVEISGDPTVTVSGSSEEIKSFSIDMLKFDQAATNYKAKSTQNIETNEQQIENKQEEVVKEDTTIEKNPQTGIEKIGISVIFIGLISFLAYIIVRNKKVFTK